VRRVEWVQIRILGCKESRCQLRSLLGEGLVYPSEESCVFLAPASGPAFGQSESLIRGGPAVDLPYRSVLVSFFSLSPYSSYSQPSTNSKISGLHGQNCSDRPQIHRTRSSPVSPIDTNSPFTFRVWVCDQAWPRPSPPTHISSSYFQVNGTTAIYIATLVTSADFGSDAVSTFTHSID